MTTIIPFTPSIVPGQPPYTFQCTLDGSLYNCTVTWSLYGQRWIVSIVDQSGSLVVRLPMVGSSNGQLIADLSWDPGTGNGGVVTASTGAPHFLRLGAVVVLSISGASPGGYNVTSPVVVTGPSTFTYPLAADPGTAVVPGQYSYDVDLVRGYFLSTMVWRIANSNIEINP